MYVFYLHLRFNLSKISFISNVIMASYVRLTTSDVACGAIEQKRDVHRELGL